MLKMHF